MKKKIVTILAYIRIFILTMCACIALHVPTFFKNVVSICVGLACGANLAKNERRR